tara:strand:+ start:623 stop:796 length:174 start_codon:yes stop_codon:yes gene_type:complete
VKFDFQVKMTSIFKKLKLKKKKRVDILLFPGEKLEKRRKNEKKIEVFFYIRRSIIQN